MFIRFSCDDTDTHTHTHTCTHKQEIFSYRHGVSLDEFNVGIFAPALSGRLCIDSSK